MTGVVLTTVCGGNTLAVLKYIWLMPHKIVLLFESFKTPFEAISLWLLFNRPCLNVNYKYLFQTHSFFSLSGAFCKRNMVLMAYELIRSQTELDFHARWLWRAWKPKHFIQISEFSGRVGSLFPVAYNAPFVIISQQWFKLWDVLGVIYLPKQSH